PAERVERSEQVREHGAVIGLAPVHDRGLAPQDGERLESHRGALVLDLFEVRRIDHPGARGGDGGEGGGERDGGPEAASEPARCATPLSDPLAHAVKRRSYVKTRRGQPALDSVRNGCESASRVIVASYINSYKELHRS